MKVAAFSKKVPDNGVAPLIGLIDGREIGGDSDRGGQ